MRAEDVAPRMTKKQKYLAAGFKLLPCGGISDYIWSKHLGRLGSRKDHTWIRNKDNRAKGHHSCCGSKRDYYHKLACPAAAHLSSDDLSDLKDI
jgi:hypothetical protein